MLREQKKVLTFLLQIMVNDVFVLFQSSTSDCILTTKQIDWFP